MIHYILDRDVIVNCMRAYGLDSDVTIRLIMPAETSVIQLGDPWRPFDDSSSRHNNVDVIESSESVLDGHGTISARLFAFESNAMRRPSPMRELVRTRNGNLMLLNRPPLYIVVVALSPDVNVVDQAFREDMAVIAKNRNPARGKYGQLNCNLVAGIESHSSLGRLDNLAMVDLEAEIQSGSLEILFREFSVAPNTPTLMRYANPRGVFVPTTSLARAHEVTFTFSQPPSTTS